MAIDATGTPTPLGIPKFNTAVDAPSGKGTNAMMDAIDALIAATPQKPSGLATGEFMVYDAGTAAFKRSTIQRPGMDSLGTGTPSSANFLRGDGAWTAVAAGSLVGIQVLTGSGTYTPTSGTTRIFVEAVGGGGAGGGVPASTNARGGGGGAGAYAASLLTSGFSGAAYAVGAGGTGVSGANGNAGADTTWASTVIVAKGGSGGIVGATTTNVAGGAGGSAAASTGTIKSDGQAGQIATTAGGSVSGGDGGNSLKGPGARGTLTVGAGVAAGQYGGGGGGAVDNASVARAGGAGAAGTIIVWEFA